MTKVDIFSGFLGAGKTTLIKKLISEAYKGQKVVLIENEFGEIGIDGGFLKDAGIEITEMNSGCICCSLVGDFGRAMEKVLAQFSPDRILIEPSGVGKLSDIIRAVQRVAAHAPLQLNSFTTVADARKCSLYMKNFGEFYDDQISHANTIILSRTQNMEEAELGAVVALLRTKNATATIITTSWSQITGSQILAAMEKRTTLDEEIRQLLAETAPEDDDEDEDEHDHDEHDHDEHDGHEEGHEHHHHHHHHGEHDADEVFTSWGRETPHKYTEAEIRSALEALSDQAACGTVLRAKGIVASTEGKWFEFDFVPGEIEIRRGGAEVTGRLCVIGSDLKEDRLAVLFKIA